MGMLARLRYELGRRRPRTYPYRRRLLVLLHEWTVEAKGSMLTQDEFLEVVEPRLGPMGDSEAAAMCLHRAWDVFRPGWRENALADFYAGTALMRTLRLIDYASQPSLVEAAYTAPYRYARERLRRLDVLDIGAGIPHGLLTLDDLSAVSSFTINEIDAPYTEFALWFCRKQGIRCELIPAVAAGASVLPASRFNFVYAKDVFEHLRDPEVLLGRIIAAATPIAVLALDLDPKKRGGEHVSPDLPQLRRLLEGWDVGPRFESVQIYERLE